MPFSPILGKNREQLALATSPSQKRLHSNSELCLCFCWPPAHWYQRLDTGLLGTYSPLFLIVSLTNLQRSVQSCPLVVRFRAQSKSSAGIRYFRISGGRNLADPLSHPKASAKPALGLRVEACSVGAVTIKASVGMVGMPRFEPGTSTCRTERSGDGL